MGWVHHIALDHLCDLPTEEAGVGSQWDCDVCGQRWVLTSNSPQLNAAEKWRPEGWPDSSRVAQQKP